jgi:hypothetical protein
MTSQVAAVVEGVAMTVPATPTAPPDSLNVLELRLAVNRALSQFRALEELCPAWKTCGFHNLLVGKAYLRVVALQLVGPGPRAYLLVHGALVPSWS